MTRPGLSLRALAARVCSARTLDRLIDPTIADLQREHGQARRRGAIWTARWVRLRGCLSVATLLTYAAVGDASYAIGHWNPGEAAYLRRSSIVFLATTIVTTMLITYPQPHRYSDVHVDLALLTIYLIPSILPLSTASAALLAIVCGGRERLTRKLTAAVLTAGFVCSIVMFADMAWVVPDSNQAFRELIFSEIRAREGLGPLVRGDNEMSMSELRQQIVLEPDNARRHAFAFTYHARWSLAFGPLVLAGLALLLMASMRRTAPRAVVACALCVGYWLAFLSSRGAMRAGFPVVLAAWLPNLIFLGVCLIAAAIAAWRSKTSLLRALIPDS